MTLMSVELCQHRLCFGQTCGAPGVQACDHLLHIVHPIGSKTELQPGSPLPDHSQFPFGRIIRRLIALSKPLPRGKILLQMEQRDSHRFQSVIDIGGVRMVLQNAEALLDRYPEIRCTCRGGRWVNGDQLMGIEWRSKIPIGSKTCFKMLSGVVEGVVIGGKVIPLLLQERPAAAEQQQTQRRQQYEQQSFHTGLLLVILIRRSHWPERIGESDDRTEET